MLALVAVAVLALCAGSAAAQSASDGAARIAFSRTAGESLDTEIWTGGAAGGNPRRIVRLRHAAADEPAWSPSGRSIAFVVDHDPPGSGQLEIYVARADGRGVRRLTQAGKTEDSEPAWSTDGGRIAFSKYTRGGLRTLGVYVMRTDGRLQHRLTRSRCDYDPAWSPNGKRIAVSRCGALFIVNADGTHARRLTRPPPGSSDEQPDWSPKGRSIAFVRIGSDDRAVLWLIRTDGKGERQLTDGGDEHSPSWSPSGRFVAFASYTAIRAVNAATGQMRVLVTMRGSDLANPTWRPPSEARPTP
jgi:Tol biopolymer transport system component